MIKLIKGTNRYFINDGGYCFKVDRNSTKEHIIPLNIIQGIPKVKIEDKKLRLVNLMVEYFIGEIQENTTIKFKIVDGKVPLEYIKIINHIERFDDDITIFKYRCSVKASAANTRVNHSTKIDKHDVLDCLKISNFKCHYCGTIIKSNGWHLDHVHPISKGGMNLKNNIIPSCRTCNLMKGDMQIDKFVYQCNKILINFNQPFVVCD